MVLTSLKEDSFTVSREELKARRVPLAWRDGCAGLLLALNGCRKDKYYKTWECDPERHAYEKCQYDDYVRRMEDLARIKQESSKD